MECTKFTRLGKRRNLKPDVQFKDLTKSCDREFNELNEMIKRAISFDDKISIAHVKCTHLCQVIKSQNKIIYTIVNILNIYIH